MMTNSTQHESQFSQPHPSTDSSSDMSLLNSEHPLKISLISLHGLIRANDAELGCDADTGGQVKYVIELARELASHPNVGEVELLTRQIIDPKVSADYAQIEESIAENARIVRIPFGPRRYLKKEALWPYIEMFVDQTLAHYRRYGLPDIIHGHYADAGLAGAQLARLLHVPFIFTGHSLGRVKRERLLLGKSTPDTLEKNTGSLSESRLRKLPWKRHLWSSPVPARKSATSTSTTITMLPQEWRLFRPASTCKTFHQRMKTGRSRHSPRKSIDS